MKSGCNIKPLLFTGVFSPLSETFIYSLATGLLLTNPRIRIATLKRINEIERPFPAIDVFPYRKIELIIERSLPFVRSWRRKSHKISFHDAFIKYLYATRPSVVHAQFATNACAVAEACKHAGIPLVVSFRGFDASMSLRSRYWRLEFQRMLRIASAAVIVSEEMRDRVESLAPKGLLIRKIHAGKDPESYPFSLRDPQGSHFVSVGRLTEKKGHDDAIRAVSEARRLGLDAQLTVIGSGSLKKTLERLARSLRINEHVRFTGALSHNEVKQELARADALIVASRTAKNGDKEGVPNVLKEAQLMGLPFVATDHGGARFAVPPAARRDLVPEGDWKMLAKRLIAVSSLPSSELYSRLISSRAHTEEHFSLKKEVEMHLKLYEQLQ